MFKFDTTEDNTVEINVSSAIEEILDRRETVTLVGIGSLALENFSAKVAEDGKTISPPKAKLKYYDVQTSNKPLRKYLCKKYDISKKDSEKAIKKFSQSILNGMANFGEVNIEGIARIKRKGRKIKVSALDSYKSKYYAGLPEVPISKVSSKTTTTTEIVKAETADAKKVSDKAAPDTATKKSSQPVYTPPRPETKKPDSKPAPLLPKSSPPSAPVKTSTANKVSAPAKPPAKPLVPAKPVVNKPIEKPITKPVAAIGSTATAGLASGIKPQKVIKPMQANKPTAKASDKPISLNEKLGINSTKKTPPLATNTKRQTTTASTHSAYVPPVPPKKEKFGCLGPFVGFLGLSLLIFLLWKGFHCITNSGDKTAGTMKAKTEEALTKGKDAIASDDDTITAEEADKGEGGDASEESPEECIIITGSFSSYQNVSKMEQLLESKGYDVYIQEYGPYTRVGFTFDCAEKDLPSYLYDIRDRINSKAWYLEPDLHVDYR